jgi:integrase
MLRSLPATTHNLKVAGSNPAPASTFIERISASGSALFDEIKGVNRFNWHGLRHFAVSCWIEAGLAAKTVQTFAGHASLQVTMDRYGHLFPSDDHRNAMDQIARGLFA